jgi:hypothetical protein
MKWMLRDKHFCRGSLVAKSPQYVKDRTLVGGPGVKQKNLENCMVWQEFGRYMIITYGVGNENNKPFVLW